VNEDTTNKAGWSNSESLTTTSNVTLNGRQ